LPAIGIRPELDNIARISIHSSKFEAGLVVFPTTAAWLAGLEAELFAFPAAKHDDQVDSISQALAYRQRLVGALKI
jgi:predicted phage terminase large subunit-like protein